jgi:hypothetical protein
MKRNMVIGAICVILALVFAVNACDLTGGGNGNGSGGNGNGSGDGGNGGQGFLALAKADIVDATNLVIAPDPDTKNKELYKITGGGSVEKVRYYDEENKEMSMKKEPSAVYNVNNEYTILVFGSDEGYLARKSDGAVFSLKDVGIPYSRGQFYSYQNAKIVQTDSSGNIYYPSTESTLIKINISDPNKLTKTDYIRIENNGHFLGYDVNPDGNVAYSYSSDNRNSQRIRKSNGGLYNLPGGAWWIGLDGKIKLYANPGMKIITFTITSSFDVIPSETDILNFYIRENVLFYLVRFSDRILLSGKGIQSEEMVYEVENPGNTPRAIPLTQISTIKHLVYSNDYYYVSGNNGSQQPVLLKINPASDAITTLLPPNQYDIYAMAVDLNNVVTFNALRMSDGAIVIGEISAAGKVTILDATINAEVTVLERIR